MHIVQGNVDFHESKVHIMVLKILSVRNSEYSAAVRFLFANGGFMRVKSFRRITLSAGGA